MPPAYSPYLNLARGGNPAINYYGIVRPQIAYTNAVQTLQQQINSVSAQAYIEGQATTGLPVTGHQATYMNYSHFFPALGVTPGAPSAAARPAVRPATGAPTGPAATQATIPAPRRGGAGTDAR